jgi:hypothetical protein
MGGPNDLKGGKGVETAAESTIRLPEILEDLSDEAARLFAEFLQTANRLDINASIRDNRLDTLAYIISEFDKIKRKRSENINERTYLQNLQGALNPAIEHFNNAYNWYKYVDSEISHTLTQSEIDFRLNQDDEKLVAIREIGKFNHQKLYTDLLASDDMVTKLRVFSGINDHLSVLRVGLLYNYLYEGNNTEYKPNITIDAAQLIDDQGADLDQISSDLKSLVNMAKDCRLARLPLDLSSLKDQLKNQEITKMLQRFDTLTSPELPSFIAEVYYLQNRIALKKAESDMKDKLEEAGGLDLLSKEGNQQFDKLTRMLRGKKVGFDLLSLDAERAINAIVLCLILLNTNLQSRDFAIFSADGKHLPSSLKEVTMDYVRKQNPSAENLLRLVIAEMTRQGIPIGSIASLLVDLQQIADSEGLEEDINPDELKKELETVIDLLYQYTITEDVVEFRSENKLLRYSGGNTISRRVGAKTQEISISHYFLAHTGEIAKAAEPVKVVSENTRNVFRENGGMHFTPPK